MASTAVERLCERLDHLKTAGNGWTARCPGHEDAHNSLSISEGRDGRALVKCHAGCATGQVLDALGLQLADLFPKTEDGFSTARAPQATFAYTDAQGNILYEVLRFPNKEFRQRRPDGRGGWIWNMTGVQRVPYRLHNLHGLRTVCVVEGEKDAETLWRIGIPATTNVAGAGKWKTPETMALKNAGVQRVVILPDNDQKGKEHGEDVAGRCRGAGLAVSVLLLPDLPLHGDVTDWLATRTKADLEALIAKLPFVLTPAVTAPDPWARVLERLEARLTRHVFTAWFQPTKLLRRDDGTAVVGVANETALVWVTKHLALIEEIAQQLGLHDVKFAFEVAEVEAPRQAGTIDPRAYHLTDLGNAEAFRDRFGHLVRYDRQRDAWLLWDTHRWAANEGAGIRRLAHEHVRSWQHEATMVTDYTARKDVLDFAMGLERTGRLNTMMQELRVLLPVSVSGEEWDRDPWLLGVANGIIDLRTGVLRPGAPTDAITKQARPAFDPAARAPRWEQFVHEVFDGDVDLISYVQRAVGYSLTGLVSEQCFFMAHGVGANGKSTLLTVLDHVFGDYAHTTDIRTFTITSDAVPYELAQLAGRRLILTSEARTKSHINEQVLKNFTGGERIEAQHKYGHPFSYAPVGKIWFAVNHQPKVSDESYGFWRRVRMLPFLRTFSGSADDRDLGAKLRTEAAGILAWALEGCRLWQQHGLNPPAAVVTATDAYQQAEDPIADFLAERTVQAAGLSVAASVLYKAYKSWASDQGLSEREMLAGTNFGRHVARLFERTRSARGQRYNGVGLVAREPNLLEPRQDERDV